MGIGSMDHGRLSLWSCWWWALCRRQKSISFYRMMPSAGRGSRPGPSRR